MTNMWSIIYEMKEQLNRFFMFFFSFLKFELPKSLFCSQFYCRLKQYIYATFLESWGPSEAIDQVFKLPDNHQECQEAQWHHPYMTGVELPYSKYIGQKMFLKTQEIYNKLEPLLKIQKEFSSCAYAVVFSASLKYPL